MFKVPERFRVKRGPMRSDERYGNNGQFIIASPKLNNTLLVQASDGMGWEHVSVSIPARFRRCPTWEEMCMVKELFWDADDLVVQFHPVESEYVNIHPHCLHMWRKCGTNEFCDIPPKILVGKSA